MPHIDITWIELTNSDDHDANWRWVERARKQQQCMAGGKAAGGNLRLMTARWWGPQNDDVIISYEVSEWEIYNIRKGYNDVDDVYDADDDYVVVDDDDEKDNVGNNVKMTMLVRLMDDDEKSGAWQLSLYDVMTEEW